MEHEKISYVAIVYGVDVQTKSLDSDIQCHIINMLVLMLLS